MLFKIFAYYKFVTSGFILKTKYIADKSDLKKKISDADNKIPGTSRLVKKQTIMLKLVK